MTLFDRIHLELTAFSSNCFKCRGQTYLERYETIPPGVLTLYDCPNCEFARYLLRHMNDVGSDAPGDAAIRVDGYSDRLGHMVFTPISPSTKFD